MSNIDQLDALMAAVYDDNSTPQKTAKFAAAVPVTDRQAQAKYSKDAADLTQNQRAWFALDYVKSYIKATVGGAAMQASLQVVREARRQARLDAATASSDM